MTGEKDFPHMTLLQWRKHFANCDGWFDFVRDLHLALGYQPGVYVTPELLLMTAKRLGAMDRDHTKQAQARALEQLRRIEKYGGRA